ncbi:MFS transporter [Pseudogulbenkiania subflava]|uniref:MFS transporter, putative metabolite transport protein n=1 Tax=Pseudogulbenkiania subflava DSM 22618 TaxID=1123014 RepID=A0A1Y6BSQ5_9NEIS|nr:MFS transporter [Pseudogulbenkiania subflava]SMF27287.1 MFS transporter, putative metabolite transport protein [Pseudogulbenkiania subflava DSM 22618]
MTSLQKEAVVSAVAIGDETSAAFKRRFMIRMILVLTGGTFLDGYILGIVGPVASKMTAELGISVVWEGLIAAGALFGILFGSPLGGWAGDKFGRKPLFMLDIGLFVIASVMQFFTNSPLELFVVRLLMGVAIGAEYSVGWPMLSEFSPARLRGRLMGLTLIAWYAGFMFAFVVGYLLNQYTDLGWRNILGTSTFIAVALFLGRLGMPESPRWLWSKGRTDQARSVARRYMGSASDLADIEKEVAHSGGGFRKLFSRQYWRSTLFVSLFFFCVVTPYFAIATFADTVLQKFGLGGGLAGGVGLSAVALAGSVATVLLIDKAGRRVLTVPPQWIITVILVILGLWAEAPGMAVLGLFLAFSFFNAGCGTLTCIYPGEVFPTEIRGIGTGFAAAFSRIGAGLGTFLMPWSMSNLGPSVTILIAAGIAAVGAGVSQWLAPETKGKSLSETASGFSH